MKKTLIVFTLFAGYNSYAQNTFPATGSAGIGTTTPGAKLEITDVATTGTNNAQSLKITNHSYSGTTPTNNIFSVFGRQFISGVGQTPAPFLVVRPDGKVAVNKATASYTLDVGGEIHSDNHIRTDQWVVAGKDVQAAENLRAGEDIYCGFDAHVGHDLYVGGLVSVPNDNITGGYHITAGKSIYAGTEVNSGEDMHCGFDMHVAHDLGVGYSMSCNGDISATLGTITGKELVTNNGLWVNGLATIHSLLNSGNVFVTCDVNGVLDVQHTPTLSVTGNTLKLTNGGAFNTSVTLPATSGPGDNLGNHTATTNLNMNSKAITNATTVNCSGVVNAGSINTGSGPIMCGTIQPLTIQCMNGATFGASIIVSGTTYTSDKRFKKDITPLSNEQINKLYDITPYRYKFKQGEFERTFDDKVHFGFIAQEVQELFPDVVKPVDDNGYLGIDYVEFIPLLLQAVKEEHQNAEVKTQQISALEEKIANLEKKLDGLADCCTRNTPAHTGNTTETGINRRSVLNQNNPNPFSKETTISFDIVEKYNQAFIGIYDLNGREVGKSNIIQNTNSIVVRDLQPGMYVYSLVVDGALIDSKKMVVLSE